MKRIFIINAVMVLLSVTAFSQSTIKISELPLHSGNPNGGYAPISIGGVTKKFNIGTFVWTGGTYSNPTWLTSISPSKLLQGGAAIGQILKWNGSNWVPSDFSGATGTAGGHLLGTYPNPSVNWSFGYTTYDVRYQPLDGDLTSIAGLMGTSGILRKTAANTWYLDVNSNYISDVDTAAMLDPYLRKSALDNSSSYKDTLYNISPTNATVNVGGVTVGYSLTGKTWQELIRQIVAPYVNPVFTSFAVSGQNATVEVGTTLSGNKTFTWAITQNSGTVNNIHIYDITLGSNIATSTPNDGSQSVTLTTKQLNSDGANQQWKGIGIDAANGNATFNSSTVTVTARYYRFFGAAASTPSNSSEVRALPSSSFRTGGGSITLNTGTTYNNYFVALPPGITITSVIDQTALNADITSSYVLTGTITVNDAGGTGRTYNLYKMTIGTPYSENHAHYITHN